MTNETLNIKEPLTDEQVKEILRWFDEMIQLPRLWIEIPILLDHDNERGEQMRQDEHT